jgi:hypothetical protein
MLLTLFLSALFAGAVYWVHGDIEFHAQRRSMSPIAIAHSSVLLGCFFAVKAWSYGLDRYLSELPRLFFLHFWADEEIAAGHIGAVAGIEPAIVKQLTRLRRVAR